MSEHITTELVDAVARHAYVEAGRHFGRDASDFDAEGPERQQEMREGAKTMLELVVPVLIEDGWQPPLDPRSVV